MEVSTIKAQIKNNNIQKSYIFTGEEWKVQTIYIEQIAKHRGLDVKYIDSIKDIYASLHSKSFIVINYVYVVRDDEDILTDEHLQEQVFGQDSILGNSVLILLLTNVDKRKKFYKTYKDSIAEFEHLPDVVLKKYIKKEIDLSDENCEKLIEVCESDYGRILLEIDKIKHFEMRPNLYPNSIFERLLKDGTIYTPPKDAIFDLVDAILLRSTKCFGLYEQCKNVGEASLVILSVLYTNTKAVLQVQSCDSKDVSKSTGLTAWQIKNASKYKGRYRTGELVYILRTIQEIESGIKSGKIEDYYSINYLLCNIL